MQHYYQVLLKALMLFCETSTCQEGNLAWQDLLALKIRVCRFQFCDAAEVAFTHKKLLVQFGFKLDMKEEEKKQNPSIFLAMDWNSS